MSEVVYSSDGSSVYASGYDGAVVAWDLTGARGVVRSAGALPPAARLGPFSETTRVLAAEGSLAVAYRDEGALELLEVPAGTATVVPVDLPSRPARVLTDPTGRRAALVTAHWPDTLQGEIQVVDVAGRRVLPNTIHLAADFTAPAPVLTADGRSLVTASERAVVVWDVQTGQPAAGDPGYSTDDWVASVAADAAGRVVALGLRSGRVEVADTATRELVAEPVLPGGEGLVVSPLIFSPDGRWLAGGSESGRVVVWDTETWEVHRTWVAVPGEVDSLAFTPDARVVVAGGGGTAAIWAVGSGEDADMTLDLGASSRADVAVATLDGGRTVVTLTEEHGVQLWPISPRALLAQACDVAGRDLTPAEWGAALPTLPYVRTCSGR